MQYLDHGGHVVQPEGAFVVPTHHQAHTLEKLNAIFMNFWQINQKYLTWKIANQGKWWQTSPARGCPGRLP